MLEGNWGGWKLLRAMSKWLDDRGQLLEDKTEIATWRLTTGELSNIKRSENLEGACGEVDRGRVVAARAGVRHGNIDGLALPGDSNLLTTVRGLGTRVSVGAGVEGSDQVGVRVLDTTGTSVPVLSVPSDAEIGVRKR